MNDTHSGIERREARFHDGLELRAAAADRQGPGMLAGYAVVFGSLSEPLVDQTGKRRFREIIAPGAFADSLATRDMLALRSHSTDNLLGRLSAGTMRAREDAKGLYTEIDLPDTTVGRDTAVSVARRDLKGMSFGFITLRDTWDLSTNPPTRTVLQALIDEVTVTADPAYVDTSVALRSLDTAMESATVPTDADGRDDTEAAPLATADPDAATEGAEDAEDAAEGEEQEQEQPPVTVEMLRLQLDLIKLAC